MIIRCLVAAVLIYVSITVVIVAIASYKALKAAPASEQESHLDVQPRGEVKEEFYSPWNVSSSVNPVDDSKTVTVSQGVLATGSIMIRCGKKFDAYFNTPDDRMLDTDEWHSQVVRVRYGDAAPLRQTWAVADSFDALFAPSPAQFIRSFVNKKSFVIEYRMAGLTETSEFDAVDLGDRMNTIPECQRFLRKTAHKKEVQ